MTREAVQYRGRNGRTLLHQTVENETQFAADIKTLVGMYCLLHRFLTVVFQVQNILENAFKEKQGT
jgi:hypothetical protein